jgi:hypothetical protein
MQTKSKPTMLPYLLPYLLGASRRKYVNLNNFDKKFRGSTSSSYIGRDGQKNLLPLLSLLYLTTLNASQSYRMFLSKRFISLVFTKLGNIQSKTC